MEIFDPALHIPIDGMLLVSSNFSHKNKQKTKKHILSTSFLLQRFFPITFSTSCSCPVQLYCGHTQAFTQYIKLN